MATHRAPKQWCLTKIETVNSFENWRQNLIYTLSLDPNFAQFLVEGVRWEKKARTSPHRGFLNDGENIAEDRRRTRDQNVGMLELMLGQIANYAPIISRSTIVKNSTSVEFIWQQIRLHYGFQSTGAHLIDFCSIKLEPTERPEDLYQRLMAFTEDTLLRRDSGITHHSEEINEDEELSPSLENFVVLTWLRLIHNDLPRLVKQRYGTELRSRTLASIKPEISQALDSLREELQTNEDAKAMRTAASYRPSVSQSKPVRKTWKSCPLCKTAGRSSDHFLSKCSFLPDQDQRFFARTRQVAGFCDDDVEPCSEVELPQSSIVSRVRILQSPYLDVFHHHNTVRLTIDSGATGDMIRASCATRLGLHVTSTTQSAHQADGSSPLKVLGETRVTFSRDGHDLYFEGLVVENLDSDVLAGIPFMEANDVLIRPAKRQVILGGTTSYSYSSPPSQMDRHAVRRVLRAPLRSTIWPGEYLEIQLPGELGHTDGKVALEPHETSSVSNWPPPSILSSVSGKIRIPNLTSEPQQVKRNEHFCVVRNTFLPDAVGDCDVPDVHANNKDQGRTSSNHSDLVNLDPDNLMSCDMKAKFKAVLAEFDEVFNPVFKGYNGAVGPFQAQVNMGPVQPPQRKGRVPQYSRNQLVELQDKFDELEDMGVFRRPEDINVAVEYVNPSFLVKKPSGGFRLVTAFADVGRYSKPQPSLMPDVDSTLRQIAQWKYIVATDLTKAFYQIPLSRDSMKYCGVVTPFKGVRVYARCAMGMPGSETALEELTCRVLGDLTQKGCIAKVADDLYCGGNTLEELLENWTSVLQALHHSGLNLSATKTVIAPKQTSILGWIWCLGTIRASPHRISTLSTCPMPSNVSGLRSFIGAYKVLARVVKDCSNIISALDEAVAGRDSKDAIDWSDETIGAFTKAQKALLTNRTITLPRPDDQLWIVTDGAVRNPGLGATLYSVRKDKVELAGFFSAKVRKNQARWLPCEIEALSIAAAIKHFAPYIIQSSLNTCVLTDSKPCVQAFEKLCRGEFSASPRVTTFLSTASRFQVSIRHVSGSAILPSDFASRNAPPCDDPTCQICTFVSMTMDSVIRSISSREVLDGSVPMPFISRSAWLGIQSECSDLRRTCAHLRQGTRPSKKLTNIRDIKRYLNVASLSKNGLLVVKRNIPFARVTDCIIVPRQVLDGLLTALHIKLEHPSSHQLKAVVSRYFYALDLDNAIHSVTDCCHQCASLRKTPSFLKTQSSADPPVTVGSQFAADVIKRERQLILLVRECVTSYTTTMLLVDERRDTLRDGLIRMCIPLRPLDGPLAVVRTDPAPGFKALVDDELLTKYRLSIEVGNAKNINKNPVAERAIQELEDEILRQDPSCRAVTPLLLSLATARLNTRIRSRGLSAREMWSQRDQFLNQQISLDDNALILEQHDARQSNHPYSEKSKTPSGVLPERLAISVGDIVYLYSDRNKTRARDRYLVVKVDGSWCNIQKFVGNQLRSASYRVRLTDCYKVKDTVSDNTRSSPLLTEELAEEEEELLPEVAPPPKAPEIPTVISITPGDDEPVHPEAAPTNNDKSIVLNDDVLLPLTTTSETDAIGPESRPRRECRVPKRYNDFVMYT